MANTPQAKKRIRRNQARATINKNRVSRIRTLVCTQIARFWREAWAISPTQLSVASSARWNSLRVGAAGSGRRRPRLRDGSAA